MTRKMLIDAAHEEETRVVVMDGNRVVDYDAEIANKRPLKGNIYLAKVTRVEPSLQAAFVEYGGNRHGFLAFSEIHPDYYQIPVADREALMAEERAYSEAMRRKDEEDEVTETDFTSEEDVNANQEQSKTLENEIIDESKKKTSKSKSKPSKSTVRGKTPDATTTSSKDSLEV